MANPRVPVLGAGDIIEQHHLPAFLAKSALSASYAPRLWGMLARATGDLPDDMAAPPTVGAVSNASAITNGALISPNRSDAFTVTAGQLAFRSTAIYEPDLLYLWPRATAGANSGGVQATSPWRVSFYTDTANLEVFTKAAGYNLRVRVDGEWVTAGGGATVALPNTGDKAYLPVTFPDARTRLVEVESEGAAFGGVIVNPTATVTAGPMPTVRCAVLGDSFTEGGPAVPGFQNWASYLADLTGWDVKPSGWGGTGYLNPGSGRTKFRDRLTDVTIDNPDVIVVAGGINDVGSYTAADVGTEASALFAAIESAVPNALLVVVAPFWRGGVETFPKTLLDMREAIKNALPAGAMWLDLLEQPPTSLDFTTTVNLASPVGQAAIATDARPDGLAANYGIGLTVEIGTGTANVERAVVTQWSGGSAPYTANLTHGMANPHDVGEEIRVVGSALWTGTGNSGAPTGSGNSDVLVYSDGTHPTAAGHRAIARAVYQQLVRALATA